MADFNVNSFSGSNPLDGGSSTGGNIFGSNSNTFDDTNTSYQGRSSSTGGGLGQSPWGRLTEVLGDDANLGTLFSGVGSESGGGNPFGDNPAAAQVLFGGDSQGGSPFTNLRSNIDKLVSSSTNGSNPMGGGGIMSQSPDGDTTGGITGDFGGSFSGGIGGGTTGDTSNIDFGGAFGGATSEIEIRSYIDTLVNSKLSEGGISPSFNVPGDEFGGGSIPSTDSLGTVSDETFSAIFNIPSGDSFDFSKYGIPSADSFAGGIGGTIPIEGGSIGGAVGSDISSFGGLGGSGIPSFGGGNPFA